MVKRVYFVTCTDSDGMTDGEWLVRAHNQAQAIRYVTRDRFKARVASQERLIDMIVGAGAKVLDTDEEPELELGDEPSEAAA